jgi:hypothetical protein
MTKYSMAELESRISFDRVVAIMNRLQERLRKTVTALRTAGIPFAIVGGNAVAAWVATIDVEAIRQTNDVDILVNRADLPHIQAAMTAAGFHYRETFDVCMFTDTPDSSARAGIHLLFSGEKVKQQDITPAPDVSERIILDDKDVLQLEALVRMKLNANRLKDRVHLLDMIDVGLIDKTWVSRFPPELGARLQHLFDTPEG